MKTTLAAMAAALTLTLPVHADDTHRHDSNTMTTDENCAMHDGGKMMPGGMGMMGKGMMGMMGQGADDAMTARMQQMEKRMDTMQKMMDQMMAKPPVTPAK